MKINKESSGNVVGSYYYEFYPTLETGNTGVDVEPLKVWRYTALRQTYGKDFVQLYVPEGARRNGNVRIVGHFHNDAVKALGEKLIKLGTRYIERIKTRKITL